MPRQPTFIGLTCVDDRSRPHLGGNVKEGDPFSYAPSVWDYVIKRLGIHSVLDLGSGMGHAADYFHRSGLQVIAVDGLEKNIEKAIYPTVLTDLTQTPVTCRVDLVHCQEFVEHVKPAYLDNVIESLLCGRYILMTHATPGQTGYHHVNEQPPEYWIEHLKIAGCEVMVEDTARIRDLAARDGATYLERTGLLLANTGI